MAYVYTEFATLHSKKISAIAKYSGSCIDDFVPPIFDSSNGSTRGVVGHLAKH